MVFKLEQLRDTILLRMGELQLTTEQVAEKARVSSESIRNLMNGKVKTPRLDVFLKVMDALEMDVKVDARID